MKKILPLLLLLLLNYQAGAQKILKEALSPRQTYYSIDARLDTAENTISGSMETYWVNKSTDLVPDVRLHMYLNAFRNSKSTFNSEGGTSYDVKPEDAGWINISALSNRAGTDLLPLLGFVSPDDGNEYDSTVARIVLPQPAKPGDTVFLNITFKSKLPSRIVRTGCNKEFYFAGQWFPKFGVYEAAGMRYAITGAWNCHQFHSHSEFYSNHSVYDVRINVPARYVVGSGGKLMDEIRGEAGRKTMVYRAEDIVDFAWTAWPGYAVFTDKWNNVDITLLLPHERSDQVKRQMTAVKNALEYLGKNVGPFPWPHLTFVDPPSIGSGSGGMEYTTIFTSESATGIPESMLFPEMVTVHEFGHAYFMGMLASNEFEEPWLDEGVNQFWENRIMDEYYGHSTSILNHPLLSISDKSFTRSAYIYSDNRQLVTNRENSWNYPRGTYGMMSYNKTAVCLWTLMGIIGEDATNEVFREYYRRWAFRHPSGKDFINVVSDVVRKIYGDKFGPDMNWFFDQTLFGTGVVDYQVLGISNKKIHREKSSADTLKTAGQSAESDSLYTAIAQLSRKGDVMFPVEVLIHFSNGKELTENWDGKDRFKEFEYSGKGEIEWVKIDPGYRILMDVNMVNNSMTLHPDRVPVRRISNKLTMLLEFFISSVLF